MLTYPSRDQKAYLPVQINSIDHFLDSSKNEYSKKIKIPWSEAKHYCLGLILIINLLGIMSSAPTLIRIKWSTKIFKASNSNLKFIVNHNLLFRLILSKLNRIIIFVLKIKFMLKNLTCLQEYWNNKSMIVIKFILYMNLKFIAWL